MLLVGPLMPDRSRVMTQTKRDTLALEVGGWAWGQQPHPIKKNIVMKPQGNEARRISQQWHEAIHESLWLKTQNKSELNIGTWNVHSLYTARALKMLINWLSVYIMDIVALHEIWWTGSGILEKRDCTLFYSCDNEDRILGAGFIVSKRIKYLIINFKPIKSRIYILRMRGKFLITA